MPRYDLAHGEDDLFAPWLLRFPWWGIVGSALIAGAVVVICVLVAGAVLLWQVSGRLPGGGAVNGDESTAVPTLSLGGSGEAGNDGGLPTLFLPTLTPTDTPTSTMTPTATPGPCEQVVGQGDTLITLAVRCGHNDLDVIDEILQLNGLRSAESLQLGQTILIPWPSPTPGPLEEDTGAALPAGSGDQARDTLVAQEGGGGDSGSSEPTPISAELPTPTLQPGVMWYTIQPGDTILNVAVEFNATIKILSDLNPEVTFSQCDFGMASGGGNCIVQLFEGQRVRVPAPTPTPTLSPTPSGSETPTPTPTATFNAPSLLSPGDRFLFGAEDIVTLRWVTTGTLAEGDVYLVTVTDTAAGSVYVVATRETFTILPDALQPSDGQRHLFTWDVAVGPADGSGGLLSVTFNTPSRTFFWDSPS